MCAPIVGVLSNRRENTVGMFVRHRYSWMSEYQGSRCEELYPNLGPEDWHMRERFTNELRRVAI